MANLFPEGMMPKKQMSLETIASTLTYFSEQIHLIHWQTTSYSEHKALGSLYEYIDGFKDDIIEKLMGYMNKRPKAYKMQPLNDNVDCIGIVSELSKFAYDLYEWAGEMKYCDVENKAQELSGEANKCKYLLTLS